jgi:hypothetical protein
MNDLSAFEMALMGISALAPFVGDQVAKQIWWNACTCNGTNSCVACVNPNYPPAPPPQPPQQDDD